jgi:cyclase
VEAKQNGPGRWEAYTDNGREHTGLDVVAWIEKAVALGAGEILLTAVDKEGTRKGLDLDLLRAVTARVKVPVITSGGFGPVEDLAGAAAAGASGVAIADALHWKRTTVPEIKQQAHAMGLEVRL